MSETLGLLLVRSGLLTREALYQALDVQRQTGRFLGSCLLALGMVTPDELRAALSQQFKIPIVNGRDVLAATPDFATVLPATVVERYRVAPFRREGDAIAIALYDPRTADVASEISFFVGRPIKPYLCDEAVVERTIAQLYPLLARPMMRLPGRGERTATATMAPPPTLIVQPPTESISAAEIARPTPDLPADAAHPPAAPAPDRRRPGEIIRPVGEISNRDFAKALGLEELAHDSAPIPLTTRAKGRPAVREISGASLLSIVEAAEQVFAARTIGEIGEIGVRFLRGFFDRAIVFDVRDVPAVPLARSGFTGVATALETARFPPLAAAIAGNQSYHGPAPCTEEWQLLYGQLGSTIPGMLFVAAIRDRTAARLLFYADAVRTETDEDLHQIAVLIREISTALSMVERVDV